MMKMIPVTVAVSVMLCGSALAQHGLPVHPGSMARPGNLPSHAGPRSGPPAHGSSYPGHPPRHDYYRYPYPYYGPYGPYYNDYGWYQYQPSPGWYRYDYGPQYPYAVGEGKAITVDWPAFDGNMTYRRHVEDTLNKGWRITNPRY
jgi:hypothetical protein